MSAPNVFYFPPQQAGEHKEFVKYDLARRLEKKKSHTVSRINVCKKYYLVDFQQKVWPSSLLNNQVIKYPFPVLSIILNLPPKSF